VSFYGLISAQKTNSGNLLKLGVITNQGGKFTVVNDRKKNSGMSQTKLCKLTCSVMMIKQESVKLIEMLAITEDL
jgi:hypothetical protein